MSRRPVFVSLSCLASSGRLADFLKELPAAIKRAEPSLALYLGDDTPLARRVGLRELQTSFVCATVLAKKCKVIAGPSRRMHDP